LKAEIGKWLYEKADGCEASLQRSGKNHRLEISSIILMISLCFPSQIPSGWCCNNHLEKYESQWEG
jgi:hypothetical protein